MSQDYHKTLEECVSTAQKIESEIEKFKSSIEINNSITDNLNSISNVLIQVTKQIKPITDARFRRFTQVIVGICVLNLLISAVTLFLVSTR